MIDNAAIMNAWRLAATSNRHHKATRLSVEDVKAIAQAMLAGEANDPIAKRYRVHWRKVRQIREALGLPASRVGGQAKPKPLDSPLSERKAAWAAGLEHHARLDRTMREATLRDAQAGIAWRLKALRSDPSPLARAAEAELRRELAEVGA